MPYIGPKRRAELDAGVGYRPRTAGELNYVFTRTIVAYITDHGPLSYGLINDALGALEGAKLEFYRRVAVPYEAGKIEENGDVYPTQESGPPDSEITPAQFPTGPRWTHFEGPLCGEVLAGWGPDPRPFVCGLAAGHAGQHTYWRSHE